MRTEIKPSPGSPDTYDLMVDGQVEMSGESFGVVDSVRDSILGFGRGAYMEADEIADSICRARGIKQGTR